MIKNILKNKKIIHPFILWLFSIGLFDLIIILSQKDSQSITNIESNVILLPFILGIISFGVFVINLEKIFHQQFEKVKASILSAFSFIFFLVFGIGLIIASLIIADKKFNQQIAKQTKASKNTLITSDLRLGSQGEEVKYYKQF